MRTLLLLFTAASLGCAAAPGTPVDAPLRAVVISDLNSSYGSTTYDPEVGAIVRRITDEWRPDLVLIAGDMIAGQRASLSDENVRAMWAAFDTTVAAPLRRAGIPFLFTVGNHDASGHPAHERDRRFAAEYWRDVASGTGVTPLPGGDFPFHYAVLQRGVLFIVVDASTGAMARDSSQRAWLDRTLRSDAVRGAGLRVVLGHVPLYAVAEGKNRAGEVQEEPDALRAQLERGGVRLFVSGHHHAYYPGWRGELELLHSGQLGQGPRPLIGSRLAPFKSVTLLELFPARDSAAERTYEVAGDSLRLVDIRTLPPRIDGINGYVIRRDLAR